MSLGELSEHRLYWADSVKIDRYRRALASLITPDSVVLDLGCGTGLLGLLAVQLGARHVYAVDSGSVLALAEQIAAANGVGDRITHIRSMSTSVELPELVDIVVGDQLGGLAYEPGVLAYYADARERLLKPGGAFVPDRLRLLIAPVQSVELTTEVDFWKTCPGGFDVSAAAAYASNDVHSPKLNSVDLLAAPVMAREQASWVNESFTLEGSFSIERDGMVQAIGGMFEAVMADDVLMSNNPRSPDHMEHRWNSLYPLPEPVAVSSGDTVSATINVNVDDERVTWRVTVGDGPTRRVFDQSTFFASILTHDDLARLAKTHVPRLGKKGAVWRAGLELVTQGLTIGQLERELAERFPTVLTSPHKASEFVGHLVATAEA
jgi:Ribosomal protein L11 methyltransferase (PrmA)